MSDLIGMLRRAVKKPPRVILRRLWSEASGLADKRLAPGRGRRMTPAALLRELGDADLASLWSRLADRPYVACTHPMPPQQLEDACPGEEQRILDRAACAMEHRVDMLGSGEVSLGAPIDWHKDHKTGFSWPAGYFKSIEYNNPDRPSDVKMAWEVSRLQWLMPCGQAYLLTGDDRYAAAVRDVLEDWIAANPYAWSVNWSCTMEPALRILTWSWFFHVFHAAEAWQDEGFRGRFLCRLYLHGDFTHRYVEHSDINGNHCTADACGLVFAGLFFGQGSGPQRWLRHGWGILTEELPRQVTPDGVDFEASVPYHRLVAELFLLPALYRQKQGLPVPASYRDRVTAMAHFTRAYSRPDGSSPLWGDADDARALPLSAGAIGDHRYLLGLVGCAWDAADLAASFDGPRQEVFWLLGPGALDRLPNPAAAATPTQSPTRSTGILPVSPMGVPPMSSRGISTAETAVPRNAAQSQAFAEGGFFVMRNARDHVFIDCGPVGLAGRGGHGHNDCLSFEAVLDGQRLVTDCGCYVYTASYAERNRFRSTAYHNTPRVGGEEINRFVAPDSIWHLRYDAVPSVRLWKAGPEVDIFQGSHAGYRRLSPPLAPVRTIALDHARHALAVLDEFEPALPDGMDVEIPLHLAPGARVERADGNFATVTAGDRRFTLAWEGPGPWRLDVEDCRVSPSYGVVVRACRLAWRCRGERGRPTWLLVHLSPQGGQEKPLPSSWWKGKVHVPTPEDKSH